MRFCKQNPARVERKKSHENHHQRICTEDRPQSGYPRNPHLPLCIRNGRQLSPDPQRVSRYHGELHQVGDRDSKVTDTSSRRVVVKPSDPLNKKRMKEVAIKSPSRRRFRTDRVIFQITLDFLLNICYNIIEEKEGSN